MILSYQTLKARGIMRPWHERTPWQSKAYGQMTYGAGSCSYDVRLDQVQLNNSNIHTKSSIEGPWELAPGGFTLASTIEHFTMPDDVVAIVHDKSSWARRGLAVQNTLLDPGWRGFLTVELTNHSPHWIILEKGAPIGQVLFHLLDQPSTCPYNGKYQDQERGPQEAR